MTLQQLQDAKVIAIIRGIAPEQLDPTIDALYKGGIRAIEVTFNTPGAPDMIRRIRETHGDKVFVGAGTVLDTKDAKVAIEAGAEFVLAPTLDDGMVRTCVKAGLIAVPGVMTPTEMLQAVRFGAQIVKVFPAVTVGPTFFRQVAAPLQQIPMMAVGGITPENFRDFLNAGASCVGVANAIVDPKLVAASKFDELTERAKQFTL